MNDHCVCIVRNPGTFSEGISGHFLSPVYRHHTLHNSLEYCHLYCCNDFTIIISVVVVVAVVVVDN